MSGRQARQQRRADAGQALEQASNNLLQRVPPHDAEAEQAVLGAVFVRPDVMEKLSEALRVGDFYSPVHQDVFGAFNSLYSKRQPIDLVTVADELARMGRLDAVGGQVYLASLATATMSAANAVHHARIVRDKARRRGMLSLATSLVELGFDETADPGQFAAIASEVVANILDERLDSSGQLFGEILNDFFAHLQKLQEGAPFYVPTPFHKLNGLLVGMAPGELVIVAGRPGNGKTALAMNMLVHAACRDFPAGIASLEMSKLLLTGRIFSDGAEVNAQKFRNGRFTDEDWEKLYAYANDKHAIPLIIDDKPKRKPSELRALFRKWKRDHGLKVAAVDYLQIITAEAPSNKRDLEITYIARELKAIARELEIAVIAPCQLSRAAEESKKFLLSHLRESGAIEQEADIVMGFDPWRSSQDVVDVNLVLAKSRNSRVGEIALQYAKCFSRFEEAR